MLKVAFHGADVSIYLIFACYLSADCYIPIENTLPIHPSVESFHEKTICQKRKKGANF